MKSILYQLYYGDIDPASFYTPQLKEHREFLQRKCNYYDDQIREFADKDPKVKAVFDKMLDFTILEDTWDNSNAFIQGFSLGVRMMAEAYAVDLSAKED